MPALFPSHLVELAFPQDENNIINFKIKLTSTKL
ncbi:hypothetical protein BH23BAC1_BH23BAC1_37920 [soil metagenome]